ncbi:ATPase [Leptotrichia sp. OH3620_COT-345]|uniref:ATPase n=1 Tax=Leptotrichia sp. OH3620_COT-345 TaxID=2491048 RepID=UPI000F65355E|nr:ATPase [Leptotrichia sp. OH3620_COT-345]RRD40266.1 ATPase [Leptotrichia sp. OH3620_COT-345]
MKNSEILKKLEKEAKQNKKSASYLFYGDKRVDLFFYALEFSKMVMTSRIDENFEEYESIIKKIESLQHPDIEIINRENQNIKIDEIREIIYSAIESSYNSPKKIFILSGIEGLRKESSNALLKILEEPPKDVYFILLSRSLNIIPTIKSRTIKFHIEAENNKELDVSREIYYFFDGNENNIKKWKEKGISIEKYNKYVSSLTDAVSYIIQMKKYLNGEIENIETDELDLIIKYNKSTEYIGKKVKFSDIREVYTAVNEIETEFKQEREKLSDLLGKIIINTKNSANGDKLKKLISLKNSVRNNVNIRSILFNFFDLLQEE